MLAAAAPSSTPVHLARLPAQTPTVFCFRALVSTPIAGRGAHGYHCDSELGRRCARLYVWPARLRAQSATCHSNALVEPRRERATKVIDLVVGVGVCNCP